MNVTGRHKFSKFKSVIVFLVKLNSLLPSFLNRSLLRFFRRTSGKLGLLIRYILIRNLARECGDNVSIHPNVYLFNVEHISFGDNVSVHPLCYIEGVGELSIGDNVSIAHNSSIMTTNHGWSDTSKPIKYNEQTNSKVIINSDVWVGCGCRILSGVEVGSRSIIAAGAVVVKNIEPNSIVGGIPAKVIKKIDSPSILKLDRKCN
jgi:acetyltransferase-like isoleucine patch superfamily enzyme